MPCSAMQCETEIQNIKNQKDSQTSKLSCDKYDYKTSSNTVLNNLNDLKCDLCELTASSSKGLHGHKKIIHKE